MAIHLHPMLLIKDISAPNARIGALSCPLWRYDSILQHTHHSYFCHPREYEIQRKKWARISFFVSFVASPLFAFSFRMATGLF
jgi:hypothetical protein